MADTVFRLSRLVTGKMAELANRQREQERVASEKERQETEARQLADSVESVLSSQIKGTLFVEALQELNQDDHSDLSESEKMALQILFDRHTIEKAIQ
ncbi:MAG: hypothetical protein OXP09_22545 [Gammaproteobacteria bacterium]|nr:hypothetical protein [Gammaproteobacteria bacterium]